MKYVEHELQKACVKWFRLAYPKYAYNLFSVPNGGRRTPAYSRVLKEEGMLAGVSDLLLMLPRQGYGALCIEMKKKTGQQATEQKIWQNAMERENYLYVVCRSFDQFKALIEQYTGEDDGSSVASARKHLRSVLGGK